MGTNASTGSEPAVIGTSTSTCAARHINAPVRTKEAIEKGVGTFLTAARDAIGRSPEPPACFCSVAGVTSSGVEAEHPG